MNILDVIKHLITRASKDLEPVFGGPWPNDKNHQCRFTEGEEGARPFPPLISHVSPSPFPAQGLETAHGSGTRARALSAAKRPS
ncbi:hypothetical protein [Georgenia muralis]